MKKVFLTTTFVLTTIFCGFTINSDIAIQIKNRNLIFQQANDNIAVGNFSKAVSLYADGIKNDNDIINYYIAENRRLENSISQLNNEKSWWWEIVNSSGFFVFAIVVLTCAFFASIIAYSYAKKYHSLAKDIARRSDILLR